MRQRLTIILDSRRTRALQLRPGMKADMRDFATFENPHQYAAGFSFAIVNGEIVFRSGAMTAARPGKVLYQWP
jgi:N-acyl-D-amino-acid deacylase